MTLRDRLYAIPVTTTKTTIRITNSVPANVQCRIEFSIRSNPAPARNP